MSAWRRGGLLDSILPPVFVIISAFPYFWIGLVGILTLLSDASLAAPGLRVHQRRHDHLDLGLRGQTCSSTPSCPALSILITSIGGWILTMRNNMITTLAEDYVRMARAKGLSPTRIMFDYAGRNAVLPNLTGFAMSLGFVVSGAILVEYVFSYPGVGYMLLQAVLNEDYPLMQTLVPAHHGGRAAGHPRRRRRDGDLDPRTRTGVLRSPVAIPALAQPAPSSFADRSERIRSGALGNLFRAIRSNRKAMVGLFVLAVFTFWRSSRG